MEHLRETKVLPRLWGKDGEVNMVNCKECANKRCKNNGCEHATYNCPDFMDKKNGWVDMVKVIRCKDCKHWNRNMMNGRYPDNVMCKCCEHTHSQFTGYTAPDDYCSFAERVEEND
jgi:hypothetical protein